MNRRLNSSRLMSEEDKLMSETEQWLQISAEEFSRECKNLVKSNFKLRKYIVFKEDKDTDISKQGLL